MCVEGSERSKQGGAGERVILCLRVLRRVGEHDRLHTAQPIDKIGRLVRGRGRDRGRVRGRVRVRVMVMVRVRGRVRIRVRPIDGIGRLCAERSNRGHRPTAHECLGKG